MQSLMIFAPMHHKNCKTFGAKIMQEDYFLHNPQAHQLKIGEGRVENCTSVMSWHETTHKFHSTVPVMYHIVSNTVIC
jgi:hypothetical protein